jgi:uncharacterized protein (DUF983 family)
MIRRRRARQVWLKELTLADHPERDPFFEVWPPAGTIAAPAFSMPGWGRTIWRGICCACPRCGKAKIFAGYLKVNPVCAVCGAPLGEMPADDAPPYIAMVAVLHVLAIFLVLIFRFQYVPGIFAAGVLLAGLAGLCCIALRMAKGAVIGILLKLGMRREALNG